MAAATDTTATTATKRTTRAKDRTTRDEGAADSTEERDPAREGGSRPRATSTSAGTSGARGGSGPGPGPEGSPLRSGPLRRYVRRPLWWLPVALFAGALLYATELQDAWNDERAYGRGEPLPAVVAEDYDGGEEIPILYEHPRFGPTEGLVSLSRRQTGPRPEPGEVIGVRANRENPFAVRLPSGDLDRPSPWMVLLFTVPFLGAAGRRWWTARRAQRLLDRAAAGDGRGVTAGMAGDAGDAGDQLGVESDLDAVGPGADGGDGETGARVLGRLRPRRRRDQTIVLDLFPAGAAAEDRPVCSVPVVSSLGLPVGGAVFPVEVHGRPRRFGRVVARVPDGVLWPRRRALVLPRWLTAAESGRHAVPMRRGEDGGPPPRLDQRRLRAPQDVWPAPGGRMLLAGALLALGLTIGVLGTLTVMREAEASADLPEGTVEVAAQVTRARDDGLVEVGFRLPGGRETEEALVPVPYSAAWRAGMPLLVVVDPDAPFHAQLPPEPYRAAEPGVWVWMPAVAAGLWMVRTIRWKRAVERATRDERWYLAVVDRLDDFTFRVARPGAGTASCLVTVPRSNVAPPAAVARTLIRSRPVYVHSVPAPGEKLVLRFGSAVLATTSAAAVRDRPWRRRWRTLSRLLTRTKGDPLVNPAV